MILFRQKQNKKGFTLVETLVAILALTLSLGALTVITSKSVASTRNAELRIQAELLAVEAIEIAQQKIMSKIISGSEADPFSNVVNLCGSGCVVEHLSASTNAPLTPAVIGSPASFVKNPSGSVSFGSVGDPTPFRRLIYAKQSPAVDGGVLLRAVVWYSAVGVIPEKSVVLTKELRPWFAEVTVPPVSSTSTSIPASGT